MNETKRLIEKLDQIWESEDDGDIFRQEYNMPEPERDEPDEVDTLDVIYNIVHSRMTRVEKLAAVQRMVDGWKEGTE